MIAVGTNILVHAHRSDSRWRLPAIQAVESLIERSRIAGPAIHDARVAALCLRHGSNELLTADRDFSRFPELSIRNPLT